MVPDEDPEDFCVACRLNRRIPDVRVDGNRYRWGQVEAAKRQLPFTLLSLGLPGQGNSDAPERGLAFDFLVDQPGEQRVLTRHADGDGGEISNLGGPFQARERPLLLASLICRSTTAISAA